MQFGVTQAPPFGSPLFQSKFAMHDEFMATWSKSRNDPLEGQYSKHSLLIVLKFDLHNIFKA